MSTELKQLQATSHDDSVRLVRQALELEKFKEESKIRYIAINDIFASNPDHRTMWSATSDDCWDVALLITSPAMTRTF